METYLEYCKILPVTRTQAEVIDAITIMDHKTLMHLSIQINSVILLIVDYKKKSNNKK